MGDNKFINGPLNIARLEGDINGNKKVIYLFMDYHADLNYQSECADVDNIDVSKFIFDNLKNRKSTKMLDFFFEIRPSQLSDAQRPQTEKGRYIDSINKLFKDQFRVKNNKTQLARSLKSVRLHYMDIRDYVVNFDIDSLLNLSDKMIATLTLYEGDLEEMIKINKIIASQQKFILTIFKNPKKSVHKTLVSFHKEFKDYVDIVNTLVYKITSLYKHKKVQNIMSKYVKEKIIKYIELSIEVVTENIKYLEKVKNKVSTSMGIKHNTDYGSVYGIPAEEVRELIYKIFNINEKVYLMNLLTYAKIIDLYMLRRFLDKDYISNAIMYSGISHSSHIIYILIKSFDFKITHIAWSGTKSINDLNRLVKESKTPEKTELYIYPDVLYQCSNFKDFPKDFE